MTRYDEIVLAYIDFVSSLPTWPLWLTIFSFIVGVVSFTIGGIFCVVGLKKEIVLFKKIEKTSLMIGKVLFFIGSVVGLIYLALFIILAILALPEIFEELLENMRKCSKE